MEVRLEEYLLECIVRRWLDEVDDGDEIFRHLVLGDESQELELAERSEGKHCRLTLSERCLIKSEAQDVLEWSKGAIFLIATRWPDGR